jgi:hypothetical protein
MFGRGRPTAAPGRASDLIVGSWRRTLVVAVVLVGLVGAALAYLGGVGPLRQTSYPGHPYPPTGYYSNPFGPSDDLIKAADADRVKAALLSDGAIELRALEVGDDGLLAQADTGNSLVRLRQVVQVNNAAGIGERQQVHLDKVTVGRVVDPADPSLGATWCVEERGTGTIARFARSNGQVVRTDQVTFDDRFWLVRVGERYLVTDVEVR